MSNRSHRRLLALGAFVFFGAPVWAQEDGDNCKDHPLFTRMPNYYIYRCGQSEFEMRRWPVGPLDANNKAKLQEVEGPFWFIEYSLKDGATKASGLQLQRNYQNAARQAGGTVEGTYPEWCRLELDESFQLGNSCTNMGTTLKLVKGGREFWAFVHGGGDGYAVYIQERGEMKQDVSVNELVDRLNKDGFLTLY